MRIGDREIGPGCPPYVIAEVGVNHDGSGALALELVDAAAEAGADAVKVQYFEADRLMSRASVLASYQRGAGETDPIAMLRRLELSAEDLLAVAGRAHERGIHAIASIFSVELVAMAEALGPPGTGFDAYKSASPDLVNRPLLEAMAGTGRPLIVSTGASEASDVRVARRWLEGARGRVAFMQCVSCYPASEADAALGGIGAVRALSGSGVVGYSDHTTGEDTGALAVAAGACLLEKHLTHDLSAGGPDHAASLSPAGLARYVASARRAWAMLGPPEKRLLACEADVRLASRQSLVAVRDLRVGDRIGREDVTIKRPGTGIGPDRLDEVVGGVVVEAVGRDMPIPPGAVAPWCGVGRGVVTRASGRPSPV